MDRRFIYNFKKRYDRCHYEFSTDLHEANEMLFLLHSLRNTDLFVDDVANVGAYSILASKVVNANSLAFEPVPQTYSYLLKNIVANNIESKVKPMDLAVSSVANLSLNFIADKDTTNRFLPGNEVYNGKIISVQTTTLSSEINIDYEFILLKIDLEGYEFEVLNGVLPIMASVSGIIIESINDEIFELLYINKYKCYTYNPFERNVHLSTNKCAHNYLFINDDKIDFVINRFLSAIQIKVFNYNI